ncbi:hypothetical protein ATE80_10810 [Streptomyces kanasensis]|uniref:Bacterial bifunctional deaminase-reductase C-terminal domain-containing protein n=1 Tax=Streptomyces kanasensis TaxID=936756 RepID=A0A100Y6W7_9ACTN|nr:hypothetical protein ATE80_10810 [Streptomyces kanasensis]
MRKVVYFVATTLDGFLASPDADHSMFVEGEDHGAWVLGPGPWTGCRRRYPRRTGTWYRARRRRRTAGSTPS